MICNPLVRDVLFGLSVPRGYQHYGCNVYSDVGVGQCLATIIC